MAGAFKTPCPSCEADVLVKGANLIGRKIDCPKCKYRFTVPNPEGETNDGFDVVEKPKKKSNPKALVGIALGVVALIALGVGGFMMFGGESADPAPVVKAPVKPFTPPVIPSKTPEKVEPNTTKMTAVKPPDNGIPGEVVDPDKVGAGLKKDPINTRPAEVLAPPAKMKDATNLLPGSSVAVAKISMDKLRGTPLYGAFFDKAMLDFFQSSMAFEAADMESVYFCQVDATRDPFVLIRTKKPIGLTALTSKLDLKIAENSPINQRDYFELKSNPFIRAVGRTLSMETLLGDAGIPITDEDRKRWAEKPLAFHRYDSQTLIIGEMSIVGRWLLDLDKNGDPPFQTVVAPTTPAVVDPKAPPAPTPTPGTPPAPKLYADRPDFLPLKPELKLMLNRLASDEKNPPVVMYVDLLDHRVLERDSHDLGPIGPAIQAFLPTIKILGIGFNQFNKEKLNGTFLFNYVSASDAKDSIERVILPALKIAEVPLGKFFGTKLEVVSTQAAPPPAGTPADAPPPPPMDATATTNVTDEATSKSIINVVASGFFTAVDFNINMHSDRFTKFIQPAILNTTTAMKGRMQVLSGATNWHSLSMQFVKLSGDNKPFPQGALPRVSKPERFGMPYPPQERASFFVELLPYLNQGALYGNLKDNDRISKTAWYDPTNLRAAGTWIPQLLVPYYPQNNWRAYSPLADHGNAPLGATNFVALSGIGRDSARFDPAKPEQAKLVGITGYNWGSAPTDIRDGMSNTIYLIQAAPGHSRPWIAGGGATVMGVDDKANPINDFIAADSTGKRGSYVLMADGSVRYLPETIDPATFKALVTRAGGETIADLDAKASKLPPPKNIEAELKGSK